MDKKTIIAVVVGILLVFLIVGGNSLFGSIMGGSSQSAAINNQDNTNTQDTTMPQDQIQNPDQLQSKDTTVGTGDTAVAGKEVTVNYTGMLTDGTKFDSSIDRGVPFTFTLGAGQVIKGWDLGVAGMKVGGKRILVIPASLGYGSQDVKDGSGKVVIPANSTLVFEVDLLAVK